VLNAYKVQVKRLDGSSHDLTIEEGETMLDAMIDAGLEPAHDCRMGVCMTCPAKLV
jgi:ferredoxin